MDNRRVMLSSISDSLNTLLRNILQIPESETTDYRSDVNNLKHLADLIIKEVPTEINRPQDFTLNYDLYLKKLTIERALADENNRYKAETRSVDQKYKANCETIHNNETKLKMLEDDQLTYAELNRTFNVDSMASAVERKIRDLRARSNAYEAMQSLMAPEKHTLALKNLERDWISLESHNVKAIKTILASQLKHQIEKLKIQNESLKLSPPLMNNSSLLSELHAVEEQIAALQNAHDKKVSRYTFVLIGLCLEWINGIMKQLSISNEKNPSLRNKESTLQFYYSNAYNEIQSVYQHMQSYESNIQGSEFSQAFKKLPPPQQKVLLSGDVSEDIVNQFWEILSKDEVETRYLHLKNAFNFG